MDTHDNLVGVVISKLETHRGGPFRGYIAMLAVREEHRGKGIATKLVRMAIDTMIEREADEVRVIRNHSIALHVLNGTDRSRDRSHQYCSDEAL